MVGYPKMDKILLCPPRAYSSLRVVWYIANNLTQGSKFENKIEWKESFLIVLSSIFYQELDYSTITLWGGGAPIEMDKIWVSYLEYNR
jgi:hypothetical protein